MGENMWGGRGWGGRRRDMMDVQVTRQGEGGGVGGEWERRRRWAQWKREHDAHARAPCIKVGAGGGLRENIER